MFQIKVVDNQSTIFVSSSFLPENRAIYEIMPKNVVEPETQQMTIWQRVA
jgi:hypothetical protein